MIVWFLLILGPAQSQWEEELGKEVEDLDAAEDGEAGEEPHGAADQPKSTNKGHLWKDRGGFPEHGLCNADIVL